MIRQRACGWLWLMLLCCVAPSLCQSVPDAQQQSAAHLLEAHRLLSENKPAAAIPEFRAAVALDPSNIDAHGNLGVLLFFQNNYTDAILELREALRMKPDLWKIQALLGMGERRTGDTVDARADLEKSFPELLEPKVRIEAGMELIELYSMSHKLNTSDFDAYPPQAKRFAIDHIATLQELPAILCALLLKEISQYGWQFPAERNDLANQLQWIETADRQDVHSVLAPFAALQVSKSVLEMP